MNLEKSFQDKFDKAKNTAPFRSDKISLLEKHADIESKFIKGEYDIKKFKEMLGELPELGGVVVFENLSEFVTAVRRLLNDDQVINKMLNHENAHAVEALKRGYNISYSIHFVKEKSFFSIFIKRITPILLSTNSNEFDKNGSEPSETELREDLIAILSAPEKLADSSKLSQWDKKATNE